jgi:outer membrane lipoprotein-sorting protein
LISLHWRSFAAGAALWTVACCPRPWPKELTPLPDADAVLGAATAKHAGLTSLSGTAKVDSFGPKGRVRGRLVVVAERSGRLRFEAMSPFEQPISTLVTDGKSFALYDIAKKRYYKGPATPENVSRLLPIRMHPQEIALLLLGSAPVIAHDSVELARERCKTSYRILLAKRDGSAKQVLTVDAQELRPLQSRVYANGDLLYEVRFENPSPMGGFPLPRRIRFLAPRDKVDILLLYGDDLAVNEKSEDDLFQLEVPRGATVEELP